VPIGHETVRGVAVEVPIFEYRVAYEAAAPAAASARRRQSEAALDGSPVPPNPRRSPR
jgi:hypothetical protein